MQQRPVLTALALSLALAGLALAAADAAAQDTLETRIVDQVSHTYRSVGLTAAERASGVSLAQAITTHGVDPGLARLNAGGQVRFHEDASGPHTNRETVSVITLLGDPAAHGLVGEAGRVQHTLSPNNEAIQIAFANSYQNPLVLAQIGTENGGHAISVEVHRTYATGAILIVAEPDFLDGTHATETIHWLVVEAGDYLLNDGRAVRAVTADISRTHTVENVGHPLYPAYRHILTSAPAAFSVADLDITLGGIVCRTQSNDIEYEGLRLTTTSTPDGLLRTITAESLYPLLEPAPNQTITRPVACLIVEGPDCLVDAHCDDGLRCDPNGECVECLGDADCGDDQVCNSANVCTGCTADAHCTTDSLCLETYCDAVDVDGAIEGECVADPVEYAGTAVCDPADGLSAGCGAFGGRTRGNACWFLGGRGQSCTAACAAVGLNYDPATADYAGSGARDNLSCRYLLDQLGVPYGYSYRPTWVHGEKRAAGCHVRYLINREGEEVAYRLWSSSGTTTAGAGPSGGGRGQRVCACQ